MSCPFSEFERLRLIYKFLVFRVNQSGSDNLYALPRTPVMTLDDDTDQFCSASHLRKSHSIDTSYLYEEAQSTFAEAVNPKIGNNAPNLASIKETNGAKANGNSTNLCKSKSEYNLAFASPSRSGLSRLPNFKWPFYM